MVRLSKKGQIRTVEVLIAVIFTFFMLSFLTRTQDTAKSRDQNIFILDNLRKNNDFRQCVILENSTCVNSTLSAEMPAEYSYVFNISKDPDTMTALPVKKIFADSAMIAGNTTDYEPRIIRLYYWTK